ncbi:hypothetical protein JCM15457_916 [Liquorilactobacillus sucicola DSM 21376 = JCM 15457]|uniref:Bacteriophage abortive infection AbiH n=1 Tax=Liquorilactobacillus sucicola DSM 21376 = JCM 15457 TaxID=1423806 RepID=A0A023CWV3_9LACO|nr:AbiH family protein [Liquorilactobacillus sucicola]KRN06083.1 hypothetical protein FD15_GL001272 [Liquorilactobacillus sucicola DSM 21376 = JCM 15457]GAJ26010.1 hypothetical protein JCM15457_916 [Liquorilactobacillus sucicola DSM 21376 = JCM 15457]
MVKERLVILGNGFDLALGQKNSYNEFFGWLDNNDKISKFPKYTEYENNTTLYQVNKSIGDSLLDNKTVNVWVYYFQLIKLPDNPEWRNIESNIRQVLIQNEKHIQKVDLTILEYLNFFEKNKRLALIIKSIKKSVEYDLSDTNIEKKSIIFEVSSSELSIYTFLLNQLNQFEELFTDYLDLDTTTASPYKYIELLNSMDVTRTSNKKILTFNYSVLGDYNEFTRNIHGTTDDKNIIFGLDSSTIPSTSPIYQRVENYA